MLTMASGLKPSCRQSGTKIAAMMGTVEKDEPMPMVTSRPTSSISSAPSALLWPIQPAEASTRVATWPVSRITSAKPEAAIMMKPIMAIIFMPSVNRSSASFQRTTPDSEKITKPSSAPMIIESSQSCMAKATTMATPATARLSGL
ncbi:hypothetical protein FQZ97_659360 [compost metagenome]